MKLEKLLKLAIIGTLGISSTVFANNTLVAKCIPLLQAQEQDVPSGGDKTLLQQCRALNKFSVKGNNGELSPVENPRNTVQTSVGGKIQCVMKTSYTADYDGCLKAIKLYNAVVMGEGVLNVQQQFRADINNKNLQGKAAEEAAKGNHQGSALETNAKIQDFNAGLFKEKLATFSLAIGALGKAIDSIPEARTIRKYCVPENGDVEQAACESAFQKHRSDVLANSQAKDMLIMEVARYTAEAAKAYAAMKNAEANSKLSNQAKQQFDDKTPEQHHFEYCVLNPTDPKCAIDRNRTSIDPVADNGVNFGGEGANNTFDLSGDGSNFFEEGADSTFGDKEIASVNSPFADEARKAQGILDPAAAAAVQPGGGGVNGGGGGGGLGGGGGGGGAAAPGEEGVGQVANMGSSEGDTAYEAGKSRGYNAVAKGKDAAANPFASLFDAKGSEGGIEEDRSIASGDISGQSSGLFQKISKRYGQVHADKRVEANNLE